MKIHNYTTKISILSSAMFAVLAPALSAKTLEETFIDAPLHYATRPLWFWNTTEITIDGVREQMQKGRDESGYGGFGILPFNTPGQNGFAPEYLSDDYFEVYGAVLDQARELGMTMTLYDEFGFPSGSAGGKHGDGVTRFKNQFPDHTMKRLDMLEKAVSGPGLYTDSIPSTGKLMSLVAMNLASKERINLTDRVRNGEFSWSVPAGDWRVMTFMNMPTSHYLVDYLDPEACGYFVEMTHQAYYDRFEEHFGTTIDGTFFDEPTLYHEEGRVWTGNFNEKFVEKHGFDPMPYYPALWYDIGPETAAARNYLFGFRAELYAEGFTKVIQDWATAHGIAATGHQDQEEIVNQTAIAGDLMLSFKHLDIPGVDKIGGRAAERIYKVISSAAYNWDKALVMSETYGAMGDLSWERIYHVAMDQYTAGINLLIPHAVWYNENKVKFKPELSWRHPKYAEGLPAYNEYMSRLNVLLQPHGRHVADIAMLYPVATMQAEHYMEGPLRAYHGGVEVPELNYIDISELLINKVGRDFTYLHPEVLNERVTVEGDTLHLSNPVNFGDFKVMILPGMTTIEWANLKKIKAFYDRGGKVIAAGTLPTKSAEFGRDADVVATIQAMFPQAVSRDWSRPYSASTFWPGFEAEKAFDDSEDTRWNAADGTTNGQWLEVRFPQEVEVNQVEVSEMFNRVSAYRIQYIQDGEWVDWTKGGALGRQTLRLNSVMTNRVRLYIDSVRSDDSVSIAEFSVTNDGQSHLSESSKWLTHSNATGGTAVYLPQLTSDNLRDALDSLVPTFDVEFVPGEELRYIHKSFADREIYFFANLEGPHVETWVDIRGKLQPELWNPHAGSVTEAEFRTVRKDGTEVTQVRLDLDKLQSVFVVAEKM